MILVGIDVASKKHDVLIMKNTGEVYKKHFKIDNDLEGYKRLLSEIESAKEFFNVSSVSIGIESTGVYSKNILYYLSSFNYNIYFINPLLTNMDRKASSVRKTKTDIIDTKAICMFLIRNRSELHPYTLSSYHINELKTLVRIRKSHKKILNMHINRLHALLSEAFPEIYKVFSKVNSKTCLNLLSKYASIGEFKSVRVNTLVKHLISTSRGRSRLELAEEIKQFANNSIGIDSKALSISIKQHVLLVNQTNKLINEVEMLIEENVNSLNTNILSIPGIGYQTGAIILAEIGDINIFKTDDALLAYAGLDPSVYQSGNQDSSYKMSKRGSSLLRWALFQAAKITVIYDPVFRKYHESKINQGKHYFVAISHSCKKLLRVIRSILKNNTVYQISQ